MPDTKYIKTRITDITDKFKPSRNTLLITIISIIILVSTVGSIYFLLHSKYFIQRFDLSQEIVLPEMSINNHENDEEVGRNLSVPLEKFPSNYDSVISAVQPKIEQKNRVELLRYGETIFVNSNVTPTSSTSTLSEIYYSLINKGVPVQISEQSLLLYLKGQITRRNNELISDELAPILTDYLDKNIEYLEVMKLLASETDDSSKIEETIETLKLAKENCENSDYLKGLEILNSLENDVLATSTANTQTSEEFNKIVTAGKLLNFNNYEDSTSTPITIYKDLQDFSTSTESYKKLMPYDDFDNYLFNEIFINATTTSNFNYKYIQNVKTILAYQMLEPTRNSASTSTISHDQQVYLEYSNETLSVIKDQLEYLEMTLAMLDIDADYSEIINEIDLIKSQSNDNPINTEYAIIIINSLNQYSIPYTITSPTSSDITGEFNTELRVSTVKPSNSENTLAISPIISYKDFSNGEAKPATWLISTIKNNNFYEPYDYPMIDQYGGVRIPILMYHQITYAPDGLSQFQRGLYITPENFERQIAYLTLKNYQTVSSGDFYNILMTNQNPSQKTVMLTFDDGTYSHYTTAYPILKKYGQTGVFYVIANYLNLDSNQLREMSDNGMIIDSHSATHTNLQTTDDYGILTGEIAGSKYSIESMTGKTVNSLAFPLCVGDAEAIGVMNSSGYLIGTSCGYGIDHYPSQRLILQRRHVYDDMESFKMLLSGLY